MDSPSEQTRRISFLSPSAAAEPGSESGFHRDTESERVQRGGGMGPAVVMATGQSAPATGVRGFCEGNVCIVMDFSIKVLNVF